MLLSGIIMLFFFFGFEIVASVCAKREIYSAIFVTVVAIGSVFQILLLPRISSHFAPSKQFSFFKKWNKKNKPDKQTVPKTTTWRTA
jgi:hypothetical protein